MSKAAEEVAKRWIEQTRTTMVKGNISFDGPNIKSYSRVIGVRYTHFVLITCHYHSQTTSRHRGAVKRAVQQAGLRVIFVPYPDVHGLNSHRYNHDYLCNQLKSAEQSYTRYGQEAQYPDYKEAFDKAKADLDEYELRFGYGISAKLERDAKEVA